MRHRYRFQNEDELQMGLVEVFTKASLPFQREVVISPGDRIDFLLESDIGIEVKVRGSLSSLTAQLFRYAQSDKISALILVTSRTFHLNFPGQLNHKPLRVAYLSSI